MAAETDSKFVEAIHVRRYASYRQQARAWMAAFLLSAAINHVQWFFPRNYEPEWVLVLDQSEGVFRGKPSRFKSALPMHQFYGRMATTAFLTRNPLGVDDAELLGMCFLPQALSQAEAAIKGEFAELQEKQLHQKPEIGSVVVLETRDNRVLLQISGQLVRTGVFQKQRFSETPKFELFLTLLRNPDLSRNQRWPLAVSEFTYEMRR